MVLTKSIPKKNEVQQMDSVFVQLPSRCCGGQESQIAGLGPAEFRPTKEPPKNLKTPPRRKKSMKKLKKMKANTKKPASVQPTEEVANDVLEVECSLAYLDDGTLDPRSVPVLYYHSRVTAESSSKDHFRLLRWDLGSNIRVVVTHAETVVADESEARMDPFRNADKPICIATAKGAVAVLEICLQLQMDMDRSKTKTIVKLQNIGVAVEKGLFRLMIEPSSAGQPGYLVTLWLADWAFQQCCPATINVQTRAKSTAFQSAKLINSSLADIFPDQAELLPLERERGNQSITAKDVYALVDNVKLIEVLNRKKPPPKTRARTGDPNDEPLDIPGLLPKLRPYQEAAVKWMLERERSDTSQPGVVASQDNCREWELAWVVVKQNMAPNSMPALHFLPDYMQHAPRREREHEFHKKFLFCPYTGWLAKSVEEARNMTLHNTERSEHHSGNFFSHTNGGILADGMGLGKTVEVLACILANPDPTYRGSVREMQGNIVSSSLSSTSVSSCASSKAIKIVARKPKRKYSVPRRKFLFAPSVKENDASPQQLPLSSSMKSVKIHPRELNFSPSIHERLRCATKRRRVTEDSSDSAATINNSVVVATVELDPKVCVGIVSPSDASVSLKHDNPAEIRSESPSFDVRWIDDCELGSCVCGRSISLDPLPAEDYVVLCERCHEPMHWTCAAFGDETRELSQMSGILFRRKFSADEYWCRLCPERFCPCCFATQVAKTCKLPSRATVIVTPHAILNQWKREISRHTRTISSSTSTAATTGELKVVVYEGVRNLMKRQQANGEGFVEEFCFVHPRWLADADIILMTFDALHQELGHSNKNPYASGNTSLRKKKRFRVVPSPLSSISWWRVCLDEAQRVDTPTAGSAQMALKLDAGHRWAVTGTPIGRGKLDDLFGLLVFLKATPPFDDKNWFRRCFSCFDNGLYVGKRVQHLLHSVFWRSTKSLDLIVAQMGVPPQVEEKRMLKFSSIEKRFYERQLEKTLQLVGDTPKHANRRGGNYGNFDILSRELHNLRAACCHPQVGSNGFAPTKRSRDGGGRGSGVKVLTMEQVLDRLIDDAKNQCEEALRVAIFHSNPMAAISRLKVEAKNEHNIQGITESDEELVAESCKLYQEVLDLVDNKAAPSLATGEALLTGSRGFRSNRVIVRGGSFLLDWQFQTDIKSEKRDTPCRPVLWASFEYDGQPKKMRQIRLRTKTELPVENQVEGSWTVLYPKDCAFQVASGAHNDEFVDICAFVLPSPMLEDDNGTTWVVQGGLWVQRSKHWRIVVRSFHGHVDASHKGHWALTPNQYVGVDVELFEPTIASDSLPRLHTLHNAIVSFREMKDVANHTTARNNMPMVISKVEVDQKIRRMQAEMTQIENYHLGYAKGVRKECLRRLETLSATRRSLENELFEQWNVTGREKPKGFWDVTWWDDAIVAVKLRGSAAEQQSLCQKVAEAIEQCTLYDGGDRQDSFPVFQDLNGFHVALKLRLDVILERMVDGKYQDAIEGTMRLSPTPTRAEILENRSCRVCKADWYQTGSKCRHCILEESLVKLQSEDQKLVRYILDSVLKWLKSNRTGVRNTRALKAAAFVGTKFFEVYDVAVKEVLAAKRLWAVHLDFMNVIDELDTCKTTMRLVHDGEDLKDLADEKRNSLVVPIDVIAKYQEHSFKLAAALGQLRRHEHNLQFLKNQGESQAKHCAICLCPFTCDRAVLTCGHSFCPPCVDRLRKGGHIKCPNRCAVRSASDDVFLASNERNDDGSRCRRQVKGSWGTKVGAIVSDLLVISDKGEKSIVFSMWEDMLDILQEALTANRLEYVRASSVTTIGEAITTFRSSGCPVLLLNVKNGAEGLNIIEATHVIMIEPLLNCGLDSQATARCHRIGQTRQTVVHRYIVDGTIETKIDNYRETHQGQDQIEDAIQNSRRCAIQAGGIDGGFSSKEELMDMLMGPAG